MLKKIENLHRAVREDIDNLVTYRALPTGSMDMKKLNPFIFLNHHGPQEYKKNNNGLPFGPHPHRGMETVTFIIDGELTHTDSSGGKNTIKKGGIQWMTAGRGLVHAEVSSDEFKSSGGNIEILQLWINLPKKFKMAEPLYKGFSENEIPVSEEDGGKVRIKIISGLRGEINGAFEPLSEIFLNQVEFSEGGVMRTSIPKNHVVFFYVIKGSLSVNDVSVKKLHLVEFGNEGDEIEISADEESIIIFGHAEHLKEPIAAQGPFVMNTYEEIMEAYSDYKSGKFERHIYPK